MFIQTFEVVLQCIKEMVFDNVQISIRVKEKLMVITNLTYLVNVSTRI